MVKNFPNMIENIKDLRGYQKLSLIILYLAKLSNMNIKTFSVNNN